MRFAPSPRLGLGTSRLGASGSRDDAYALLDAWVDHGGTLIDTAVVYSDWIAGERGRAETVIGEWLQRSGKRDRVTISTKGGHPPLEDMREGRLDPASLRHDVEQSLRRLGTDHIDLYLLHRDDPKVPVAEIFGVLGAFVRAGKIGAVGVSNWDVSRIAEARLLADGPVVNQPLGNILCLKMNPPGDSTIRVLDRDSYRQSEREDMTLLLFSSQCRGAFTASKLNRVVPSDYDNPACRDAIAEIVQVANDAGITPAGLVLAFLRDFSPRIVPLIGPQSPAQLAESMRATQVSLAPAVVARLAAISGWDSWR
jgi:aryl-alcohol dehydrogenase-like predicted oxidoreductase